jgi:type IV pilus assembly protein PilA
MSKLLRKSKKGFTLIELMIVVAIIGILAAIAIPNFLRFQLKSKTSESKVNLAAIRTAEEAYMAEYGVYVAAANTPATLPGSSKATFTGGGFSSFNGTLGFAPEGQVFFQYGVNIGTGANALHYAIDALGNIDGDTTNQVWGYVRVPPGATQSVNGPNGCTGIVNGTATGITNTVGPCAATYGQSVF